MVMWANRAYFKPQGRDFLCRAENVMREKAEEINHRREELMSVKRWLCRLRCRLLNTEEFDHSLLPSVEQLSNEFQQCWKEMKGISFA